MPELGAVADAVATAGWTGPLNYTTAAINSLSCASASHCSGGGNYADRTSNNAQAFVVNKT
jgi:hypothetical protein